MEVVMTVHCGPLVYAPEIIALLPCLHVGLLICSCMWHVPCTENAQGGHVSLSSVMHEPFAGYEQL